MITLYDYLPSQNAYKVRLLLHHLGRPYRQVLVPIFDGGGQDPDFLSKNPAGAVPVLELEDGRALPESNAILGYLAEGTPYLPDDAWARAQVHRWMYCESRARGGSTPVSVPGGRRMGCPRARTTRISRYRLSVRH